MILYGVFTEPTGVLPSEIQRYQSRKEAREAFIKRYSRYKGLRLLLYKTPDAKQPKYELCFGKTGGIHVEKLN